VTAATPLVLVGVSKTLARKPVLREVSFECPAGEITALLGPNGAGKTTSVAVATGLRSADTGQVSVFGRPVRDRAARGRVSLVPQDIGLPAAVTVRRCLDFVGGQRALSPFAPARTEICERLAVSAFLDRRAGGLSGGQQRRVAVALGLLRAPGLLIMDEATTNLDETARATTWQLVREYTDRGGAALVTSHIVADIDTHADRVIALNAGRVLLQSPLAKVRAQLGGSSVSVRVPAARRAAILDRVATMRLGAELVRELDPAADAEWTVLQWRTQTPLPLVTELGHELGQLGADATDLIVRPIPLGDLLQELSEEMAQR
jgi:ABC-2 type transport system ATP-binding protein